MADKHASETRYLSLKEKGKSCAQRNGFTPSEIKTPNQENRKFLTGFTLIELLVVIAIIAILMAI